MSRQLRRIKQAFTYYISSKSKSTIPCLGGKELGGALDWLDTFGNCRPLHGSDYEDDDEDEDEATFANGEHSTLVQPGNLKRSNLATPEDGTPQAACRTLNQQFYHQA